MWVKIRDQYGVFHRGCRPWESDPERIQQIIRDADCRAVNNGNAITTEMALEIERMEVEYKRMRAAEIKQFRATMNI